MDTNRKDDWFVAPPKPSFLAASAENIWHQYDLAIDVSDYQWTVDYNALKAGGVKCIIAKACEGEYLQDRFAYHCQGAYDAGLCFGAYVYLDISWYCNNAGLGDRYPTLEADKPFQTLLRALKNKKVDFVVLDLEMWYADTAQYFRALRGEIPMSEVDSITDVWVSQVTDRWLSRLDDYVKKPTLVYTARWYLDRYPILYTWLTKQRPLWLAQYPYGSAYIPVEWANVKSTYPPAGYAPWRPDGADVKMWQYSGDRYILPGVQGGGGGASRLDLNLILDKNFFRWIGQPTPEPEPQPEPEPEPPTPPDNDGQLDRIEAKIDALTAKINAIYR